MQVKISQVIVPPVRKRRLIIGKVQELTESIKRIGLLQPIIIGLDNRLTAGLHRLEACKLLGWQEIDCTIKEYDELDAELAEIDENLIRAELTVLERAEHLLERKELYEARWPETKAGVAGGKAGGRGREKIASEIISFAIDTAAKTGVSERTIQQEVQIAEKLANDVKETIRGTLFENSKKELLELARKPQEDQRKTVAQLITSSNSNEWYTPFKYVEAARHVLGEIDIDPASCEEANKIIKAKNYYTAQDDGLQNDWSGRVWLNPPYGGFTSKFVKKLNEQYKHNIIQEAILLINSNSTDTDWFQPLWDYTLCFTDHRINFTSPDGTKGNGSTHGSVFVYFGTKQKEFAKEFSQFGTIIKRWNYDD